MRISMNWLVCLLMLTACARTPAAPAAHLSLRYVNFKVYDPVYVALDQGFFARRGLEVTIIGDTLGGPTAIQAVASGSAEAGLASLPALINANASDLPVVGVSDIQSAIDDQPLEEFFVRTDSAIHSLADLRGKTVAVNLWYSSFHYTILMALEQAGIAEEEVTFVLLPFEHQALALERGQVDMIGLMQPYTAYVRQTYADEVRLLFTAFDVFGEKQFTTHFLHRDWAADNPAAARAFVAGIVDAIDWIAANPEAARTIIARYTGIEARYIPDYRFQPDGQVVLDDVRFWLEYMQQRGDIAPGQLTPEDVATNAFNSRLSE